MRSICECGASGPRCCCFSVREPGALTQFTAYAVQDCCVALDSLCELIYGVSVSIKGLCNLPYMVFEQCTACSARCWFQLEHFQLLSQTLVVESTFNKVAPPCALLYIVKGAASMSVCAEMPSSVSTARSSSLVHRCMQLDTQVPQHQYCNMMFSINDGGSSHFVVHCMTSFC